MPESGQTSFQIAFRQAELIKARESPSTNQRSYSRVACYSTARISHCGKRRNELAFSRTRPLAEPMRGALRNIQAFTSKALESALPEMHDDLEKYTNLSIVENAARRRQVLHGNKIIWRLVLAHMKLLEAKPCGQVDEEDFREFSRRLKTELAGIQAELFAAEGQTVEIDVALDFVEHLLWNIRNLWIDSGFEAKQRI